MGKDKEKEKKAKEIKKNIKKVEKIGKVKTVVKKIKAKKQKCEHMDFWSIYKIINFKRRSMKGTCEKCGKYIQLKYLGHDALSKNLGVAAFSCVMWMSPAFLIIALAAIYGEVSGYIIAIIAVIAFHFWAMYYIVKGGLVEAKIDKS